VERSESRATPEMAEITLIIQNMAIFIGFNRRTKEEKEKKKGTFLFSHADRMCIQRGTPTAGNLGNRRQHSARD